MSLFKTNKTFSIVGIGHVLPGEVMEGSINAGNNLVLANKSYVIDAVEMLIIIMVSQRQH